MSLHHYKPACTILLLTISFPSNNRIKLLNQYIPFLSQCLSTSTSTIASENGAKPIARSSPALSPKYPSTAPPPPWATRLVPSTWSRRFHLGSSKNKITLTAPMSNPYNKIMWNWSTTSRYMHAPSLWSWNGHSRDRISARINSRKNRSGGWVTNRRNRTRLFLLSGSTTDSLPSSKLWPLKYNKSRRKK